MIELKALGGMRKLMIERYDEFMKILHREGDNVFTVGVETYRNTTYFRIVLKR